MDFRKNYKILEPFYDIFNSVPDINIKRANNNEQWIFYEDPLNFKQDFPRGSLKAIAINPREYPGAIDSSENSYTYSISYSVVFKYFLKRLHEYNCPDNVNRKGANAIEYMLTNYFLPIINIKKIETIRNNCWMDTIKFGSVSDITPAFDGYAFNFSITLNVLARISSEIPIANDGTIGTFDINETIK